MADFATLVLGADTSGLKKGEAALDSIAAKGAAVEAKVGTAMTKTGAAAAKMGTAAVGSSGNMRMLTQQLSQVGQMGAVTGNYLGALAVQLPDMGLAFGAAGAIIGTVAGVALPSIIAALGGTSTAAEAAKKAVEGMSEASAAYVAAVKAAAISSDELKARFGSLGAEARLALQALADVALVESLTKTSAAIDAVAASLTTVAIANARSGATMQVLADSFGLAREDAARLLAAVQALDAAEGLRGQALAAADLRELLIGIYGTVEAMPAPLQQAYGQMAQITVAAGETQAATKDAVTAYLDMYGAAVATNGPVAQLSGLLANAGNTAAGAAQNMWNMASAAQAAINAASLSARRIPGMANPDPNAPIDLEREAKAVENALEGMTYKAKLAARKLKGGGGGGLSDAAKEAAKELKEAEKAAEQLKEELERPMVNAIEGVSDAFGDFVANGFKDFKGFVSSIKDSFKGMISEMISYALKNRIMMSMGFTSGMSPGFAAAAGGGVIPGMPGGGMGGGLLGSLLGGGGEGGSGLLGILGSFGSGASGLMTSLFGAGGGFGAAGTYLSSVLGSATTSLGAFAAAAGAIMPIIAGIGAVFSFFKTKTTQLDAGLQINIKSMKTAVDTWQMLEKKKFWGLKKSEVYELTKAEKTIAGPIIKAISGIQGKVLAWARDLNVSEKVFDKFRKNIWFSTKGMSEEQISERLTKVLKQVGHQFAGMIPGLEAMRARGEGLMDTLGRVVVQLKTVNATWRVLGFDLFKASVAGAKATDGIVKIFGTVEKFLAASSFYFDNFYTTQEKIARLRKTLNAGFDKAGIGADIPKSIKEYRALVDKLERQGRDKAAAMLIKLAPFFVDLETALDGLKKPIEELPKEIRNALNPNDFKSLFAYQVANGKWMNGTLKREPNGPQIFSAPDRPRVAAQAASPAQQQAQATAERAASANEQLLLQILQWVKRAAQIEQKWDVDGLPPERT